MISFTAIVLGKPVSKNAGQRINRFGQGYVTREAREFQMRVRAAVRAAATKAGWPDDPFIVDHCRYSVYKFNMRHDHDAGNTYIADALQYQRMRTKLLKEDDFWGLVGNDKVLSLGESPKPYPDAGPTRIEIKFELLGIVSTLEAFALRESWNTAQQRRADRRREKARAKREAAKK